MTALLTAAFYVITAHSAVADWTPKNEAEIGFGKALADFGVKDTKTVHAKDFGFNPSNSTAAIQAALDSDSTTVVIDAMPSPWHIDSVALRSGKRLLVKKGAKVLMDWRSPLKGKKNLFEIRQTQNVVIEGEGFDSYVGGYANYEERKAHCKRYGASVFMLDRATNTVIRNLRVAESEEDGVCFGGDIRKPSVDTWLESIDLVSNYRQACSICCASGVYAKGVKFRDTRGNEPSAGIDLEPAYPVSPNTDIYLFDCEFANNNGGGIVFATCSNYPIRFYAKRCHFLPQAGNVSVSIPARGEAYVPKGKKADVKIVFEDCVVESHSNRPAIQFSTAPLFDCVFRNVVLKDAGSWCYWDYKRRVSPIEFVLNRDYALDGGFKPEMTGVALFENVTATGFEGPLVTFSDELGLQSVENYFRGKVNYNGKDVDLAGFSHAAPDINEPRLNRVPVAQLIAPDAEHPGKRAAAQPDNANCSVSWNGAWFQKLPEYTYYFYAEKGGSVSFKLTYPQKIVYADMAKKLAGKRLELDTPAGVLDLGAVNPGENVYSCAAAATGWHSFRPPCQDGEGNSVPVTEVKGARLAYQSDTLGDSLGKFVLKDESKGYTGYFEVPPNADCRLRVTSGDIELYDAQGELVGKAEQRTYGARHTFRFRASGGKSEIWSFRTPPGGGTRVLKFYTPLNGIWADAPDSLPRQFAKR